MKRQFQHLEKPFPVVPQSCTLDAAGMETSETEKLISWVTANETREEAAAMKLGDNEWGHKNEGSWLMS